MKQNMLRTGAAALSCICAPCLSTAAWADPVEDFYRGKTITFYVASGSGGGYDYFARVLAKHMGRHIPGRPTIIVQNMAGAGGTKMVNFAYNVAPQDGSVIGAPLAPTPMVQVLRPTAIRYDATKLHWLGNIEQSIGIVFTWHGSATKSIADAMGRRTPMAGSGKSSATYQVPVIMNALLGTKFDVVLGYASAAAMENAMEKGEVDGRVGVWQTLNTTKPDWIREKKVNFLAQSTFARSEKLPNIPTLIELAKSDDDKKMFRFLALQNATGRAAFAPPGTPPDRVTALRRALGAAVTSKDMKDEMQKASMDIEYTTGEEVQELVAQLIATPAETVDRMKAILGEK